MHISQKRPERRPEKKTGYSCRVNILKYVKVADKWRFAPARLVNNKLKFDWVLIDGQPQRHGEGTYYIEWHENGQRRRQSVKDSTEILEQARRKAIALDAGKTGMEIAAADDQPERVRLADAVASYLKEIEPPQREPKTYMAYKYCLELFRANCPRAHIHDVTRDDVLAFIRKLYDMGCGARTAYNRAAIVAQLLKANGIKGLLHKRDWPKYVDPIRPVYEREELKALFAVCKPEERTLYLFYLLTGMRDKEVRYCEWRDVDFGSHVVRVTAKVQWGFKPKNKEEREIPVPASLLAELKAHLERQGGNKNPRNLVFPTASGAPVASGLPANIDGEWFWPFSGGVTIATIQSQAPQINYLSLAGALVGAPNNGSVGNQLISGPYSDMSSLQADVAAWKDSGRVVVCAIGGGGDTTIIQNSTNVSEFMAAAVPIIQQVGCQGVDFDLENTPDAPSVASIITQLKAQFGPSFIIAMDPRPFELRPGGVYRAIIQDAGIDNVDLVQPQDYALNGDSLSAQESYMDSDMADWINNGSGLSIPANKILIGSFDPFEGESLQTSIQTFTHYKGLYPSLRGSMFWETREDFSQLNWQWSKQIASAE